VASIPDRHRRRQGTIEALHSVALAEELLLEKLAGARVEDCDLLLKPGPASLTEAHEGVIGADYQTTPVRMPRTPTDGSSLRVSAASVKCPLISKRANARYGIHRGED